MKLTQIRFSVAVCATFLAGMLFAAPVVSITPVPQSDRPDHWWQKRFAEKQELVKKGGSAVVFIGDSIVHGLEGSAVWREKFAAAPLGFPKPVLLRARFLRGPAQRLHRIRQRRGLFRSVPDVSRKRVLRS